jgi:hypothetical protein
VVASEIENLLKDFDENNEFASSMFNLIIVLWLWV